jgi:hypothetical protein
MHGGQPPVPLKETINNDVILLDEGSHQVEHDWPGMDADFDHLDHTTSTNEPCGPLTDSIPTSLLYGRDQKKFTLRSAIHAYYVRITVRNYSA